ncbi:hypothetical protein UlMin_032827 [Ulmus minor]
MATETAINPSSPTPPPIQHQSAPMESEINPATPPSQLETNLPELRNLRTILDREVYTNKFPAKITVKEQLQILAEIKGALKESELELFRRSCFGHFLDLDAGWTEGGKTGKRNTFAGQYVHFLMLRRMPTKKKRELWFLVEGKPARFSIDEFAIVTGLVCTSKLFLAFEERVKLTDRIRDEYFKGTTQIKVDDIQKAFWSLCDKEEGGGGGKKAEKGEKKKAEKEKDLTTDRMKIALLYFLEGVILGADPKRNVSTFHMSMVDDLDMFNSYHWGTVVYDTTVDSLQGKDMAEKYRERLRKPPTNSYRTSRRRIPYTIWVFEAIPFLGMVCAHRVDGPVRFLRCLNWRCGETVPPLDKITTLSKDRRVVIHSILHPSMEEKSMPYMVRVGAWKDKADARSMS